MDAKISSIKVWKSTKYREARIYVRMSDGREGCRYITGNPWHAAKSTDGNLTNEEWKRARGIGYYDNAWHDFERLGGYSDDDNEDQLETKRGDGQQHARWETEEALADLGL